MIGGAHTESRSTQRVRAFPPAQTLRVLCASALPFGDHVRHLRGQTLMSVILASRPFAPVAPGLQGAPRTYVRRVSEMADATMTPAERLAPDKKQPGNPRNGSLDRSQRQSKAGKGTRRDVLKINVASWSTLPEVSRRSDHFLSELSVLPSLASEPSVSNCRIWGN